MGFERPPLVAAATTQMISEANLIRELLGEFISSPGWRRRPLGLSSEC